MCPVGISLELGFGQGPGGTAKASHAALMGLRFHRKAEPVLFQRCLPGMEILEKVNRIRLAIMDNLVSPAETNPDGQEILLWEDVEAQKDFEDLIASVEEAQTIEEMGGAYGAQSLPVMWIRHRPNLRKKDGKEEDEEEEEDSEEPQAAWFESFVWLFWSVFFHHQIVVGSFGWFQPQAGEDELDEDSEVQALQPIAIRDTVERTVAHKTAESSPQIQHQHDAWRCEKSSDIIQTMKKGIAYSFSNLYS